MSAVDEMRARLAAEQQAEAARVRAAAEMESARTAAHDALVASQAAAAALAATWAGAGVPR